MTRPFSILMMGNEFVNAKRFPERLIKPEELNGVEDRFWFEHVASLAKHKSGHPLPVDEIYNYMRGAKEVSDYSEEGYKENRDKQMPYTGSNVLFFKATHGYVGPGNWQQWEATDILEGYDYVKPWRMLVEGELQVVDVPSDHFSILEEPSIHIVKEHVQQIIPLRDEKEKNVAGESVKESRGNKEVTLEDSVKDAGSDEVDIIILTLREIVSEKIKLPANEIMPDEDLSVYGVDSILSTFIMERVQNQYGGDISLNAIIEHKSLRELAKHIQELG